MWLIKWIKDKIGRSPKVLFQAELEKAIQEAFEEVLKKQSPPSENEK